MKVDAMNSFLGRENVLNNPVPEITQPADFSQQLERALSAGDKKKLYSACQDLESVFISKVLESMRATIPRSDFINRGQATEIFESMLFDEYSKSMSESGALGIADLLYHQLEAKA